MGIMANTLVFPMFFLGLIGQTIWNCHGFHGENRWRLMDLMVKTMVSSMVCRKMMGFHRFDRALLRSSKSR